MFLRGPEGEFFSLTRRVYRWRNVFTCRGCVFTCVFTRYTYMSRMSGAVGPSMCGTGWRCGTRGGLAFGNTTTSTANVTAVTAANMRMAWRMVYKPTPRIELGTPSLRMKCSAI